MHFFEYSKNAFKINVIQIPADNPKEKSHKHCLT